MYKSNLSLGRLQFDVNNVKLGLLPGIFDTVSNEGAFFKNFSDDWANGYWDEGWDVEPTKIADNWYDYFLKQNEAWVNPAYATEDTNDEFVCRTVNPDNEKKDVAVSVIYDPTNDNTIVGWIVDAD